MMQEQRIRVAVIDDHRVFAEALATRLSTEPDLEVVGTAGSSVEALELSSHSQIDVVALDLDLGGEDGLVVGWLLRDLLPDLGIVIVRGRVDDARVAEAVQMGIRGWVPAWASRAPSSHCSMPSGERRAVRHTCRQPC